MSGISVPSDAEGAGIGAVFGGPVGMVVGGLGSKLGLGGSGAPPPKATVTKPTNAQINKANPSATLGEVNKTIAANPYYGIQGSAEAQQAAQAAELSQFGNAMLANYNAGKLPPGMQKAINNQVNESISEIKQQFASLGLSGSTEEASAIAQAKMGGVTEVAQQLQQEYSNAMQAFGLDGNVLNYFEAVQSGQMQASIAQQQQRMGVVGDVIGAAGTAVAAIA